MKTYFIPKGNWPLKIKPYQDLMLLLGLEESDKTADVLVLPGGSDIGIRPQRDEVEINVYQEWTKLNKPILGICRGLQLMLHFHNNSLIEHIPAVNDQIMHTTITGDWRGQSAWHLTEQGLMTNSRHHQGFHHVKEPWEVIDKTHDGIVEAIRWKNQFAVQWHPEHIEMNGKPAQDWWIAKAKEIING